MAILHSLLAMYGAFDEVATQTDDPEMRAMVEKILPGTTAPGQRGWYKQLQEFIRRNAPDEAAVEFKSPQAAMHELIGREGFEDTPAQMSSRDVGRLLQAGVGLGVLKASAPARTRPVPALQEIDADMFDAVLEMAATPQVLRTSGQPPSGEPPSAEPPSAEPPSGITRVQISDMLDDITNEGLDSWERLIRTAADANQVAPDVAAIPPIKAIGESVGPEVTHEISDENGLRSVVTDKGKVTSEVITVNGIVSTLLTTEFSRTPYDIKKVAAIIDPLNWDNANKFFADMIPKGLARDQRSSQVLEEVSTDKDIYRIKTHLKYVKELRPGNTYVINYDFADDRGPDDSMQVNVDSGYILLTPTADGNGVRVLTSKLVAIEGLSPTAVAIFAHAMGWLAIGEMMMFGDPVVDANDPIVPWTASPDRSALVPPGSRDDERTGQAQQTGPGQEKIQPVSQILIKETTKAVADYIQLASKETAAVADKWLKGGLSVEDMINHTGALGGKLASEPFRILDRMMKNVAAPPEDSPADQQGGGGSQ
jgi:hypothetical protein